MSRPTKRPHADHTAVAHALRQQPGVWLPVGDYNSRVSADNIAYRIRTGYPLGNTDGSTPYQPAGAYETRTELTEDGTRVHARYTGGAA
ncbi:hypothetical protein EASAB2608_06264 [Streptomyces sp. EAS-AB2608]|uniref:hypothetical protein n=1 Tax=Streptomyces sp. EAS-AB2608 TaxID=2779671 RepID=UPI001BEF1E60|nr:hypothetical protein [Streptomyces sp. EAS-AB2608]BCM70930.1 hypothetical protein EASAB2608_06264 [Streptomyces sp. EAS-AB2608]